MVREGEDGWTGRYEMVRERERMVGQGDTKWLESYSMREIFFLFCLVSLWFRHAESRVGIFRDTIKGKLKLKLIIFLEYFFLRLKNRDSL